MRRFRTLLREEHGVSAMEYAMIGAIITVVLVAGCVGLGMYVRGAMDSVNAKTAAAR